MKIEETDTHKLHIQDFTHKFPVKRKESDFKPISSQYLNFSE